MLEAVEGQIYYRCQCGRGCVAWIWPEARWWLCCTSALPAPSRRASPMRWANRGVGPSCGHSDAGVHLCPGGGGCHRQASSGWR
jgi:hypothetical protein